MLYRVSDDCLYSGKYSLAAHLQSNLRFKENIYTLVISNNTSWYDNHLTITEVADKVKNCHFLCIGEINFL